MSSNPALRPVGFRTGLGMRSAGKGAGKMMAVAGAALTRGTVVYVSDWNSKWDLPVVAKAKADDIATCGDLYVVSATIPSGARCMVLKDAELVQSVDLAAASDGDPVYLSAATAGVITLTPPVPTSTSLRIEVGTVVDLATDRVHFTCPQANQTTFRTPSATVRGMSPAIWSDCPLAEALIDPGVGCSFFDDFMSFDGTVATNVGKYNGGYRSYEDTGGSISQMKLAPGVVRISTTAAANDEDWIQASGATGAAFVMGTAPLWFEARIRHETITNAKNTFFLGLAEEASAAADFVVDTTGALVVKDLIGFHRIQDDGDAVDTVIGLAGGAVATVKATAVTIAAATWVNLGIKFDGTTVTFYANGVALTDTVLPAATNFPLDQYLTPIFGHKNLAATAYYADIDWWRCFQLNLA